MVLHVDTNNIMVDSPGQLVGQAGACIREVRRVRPRVRIVFSNITPPVSSHGPDLSILGYSDELFHFCKRSGVTWADAAPEHGKVLPA